MENAVLQYLPKAVILDFNDSWTLDGANGPCMDGPGLYPVKPVTHTWYLDSYRDHSVLAVKRTQLLLTPGLASTAHAAQGTTQKAVIADLRLGRGVSWMSTYVAITRVRRREHLLIYRPFGREPYTHGEMEGTKLLLQKLQG